MTNIFSNFNFSSLTPAKLQDLYIQFLANFPAQYQPIVSLVLGILIIYTVYRVIRRDFIFIIALVILVPSSIPVIRSIWAGLIMVLKYLFNYN